jgi:hypothetical protein
MSMALPTNPGRETAAELKKLLSNKGALDDR